MNPEFLDRLGRHLDGELPVAETDELWSEILGDPTKLDEFVAARDLHHDLRRLLMPGARDDAFLAGVLNARTAGHDSSTFARQVLDRCERTRRKRTRSRRGHPARPSWALPAIAACVAACAALFVILARPGEDRPPGREVHGQPTAERPEERRPAEERPIGTKPEPPRPAPEHRSVEQEPQAPQREPLRPEEPTRETPPPEAPRTPQRETATPVATFERAEDEVFLVTQAGKAAATAGRPILDGQGVETAGKGGTVIAFPDGTRFEIGPQTTLHDVSDRAGKRLVLARGTVDAIVKRQPPDKPMVVATPHGEARVLGTSLRIAVDSLSTRLEVAEGKVRLTRNGKSVDVTSGQYAVAAAGVELVAKPMPRLLFADDFEDPRVASTHWVSFARGLPTTFSGQMEIDLLPRPAASYQPGGWHGHSGGKTRRAFRLPLRISVDVEVTRKHANIVAAVWLYPAQAEPKEKDFIWASLRDDTYCVRVETNATLEQVQVPGPWPRRDRWTVDVDAQEIRFLLGEKEMLRAKHGRRVLDGYHVSLEADAKADAPQGARVRFDNLRVEEIRR